MPRPRLSQPAGALARPCRDSSELLFVVIPELV